VAAAEATTERRRKAEKHIGREANKDGAIGDEQAEKK
jgi:hypothetical protein